jgi:hypothetical protein
MEVTVDRPFKSTIRCHTSSQRAKTRRPSKSRARPPRKSWSLSWSVSPLPVRLDGSVYWKAYGLACRVFASFSKVSFSLAARTETGKTHIAKRICRFLSFFHDIPSQIFNVGDYRRQLFGDFLPADFYHPSNSEGTAARHTACDAALADLIDYMRQDGVRVAAFDATNSTKERRSHLIKTLNESGLGVKRMFVESVCDDDSVRSRTKVFDGDGMPMG